MCFGLTGPFKPSSSLEPRAAGNHPRPAHGRRGDLLVHRRSTQAVVTGAYRAVVYIQDHMKLDAKTASEKDSKEVVRICTVYAQKGMWNIFIVIFCLALALAFFNPYFFIGYLIGIAFFGLFQAIFMANAGGAWDNAKKIVEVDLRQKGTDLHAATVVGDTVGDPFKDTSFRRAQSGDQIHHAVRPARGGNRRDHSEPEF